MRSGLLRHRVAIQLATETQDAHGQPTAVWSTVTFVWASVEPIGGRELLQSQQPIGEATHRVRMRHTALTPENRILFGTRVLEINSVSDYQSRGIELELMCKETV